MVNIAKPDRGEVERYLRKWDESTARLHDEALDVLFSRCPNNTDKNEVFIKTAALNYVYNVNVKRKYLEKITDGIIELKIDDRLNVGDETLVAELRQVAGDVSVKKGFVDYYSFATKYCSRHQPAHYPIYDSFVHKLLLYFRNTYQFETFTDAHLENFPKFKSTVKKLRV